MKKFAQKYTYPFFESIGLWPHGAPLLSYHQDRINRTFHHFFPNKTPHDLRDMLSTITGVDTLHKLKVMYNEYSYKLQLTHYHRKQINKLIILSNTTFDYSYKYSDRQHFDRLNLPKGQDCILVRNGVLTDSSYANIVLIKNGQLFTPKRPLLKGCMRAFLLDQSILKEAELTINDLKDCNGIFLINALNPLRYAPFIPSKDIKKAISH